ncbi:MAG: UPF0102 protein [Vicingaceae bacterium]|nr:MAG: UPF0102 protein [Vicingaceae bacterium]
MAIHNDTGKLGEQLAEKYLEEKGFIILEKNFRYKNKEIDIIALKENLLVFIEVKTRTGQWQQPAELISNKKENLLIEAAQKYYEISGRQEEYRFDLVYIYIASPETFEIRHFEDCFRG